MACDVTVEAEEKVQPERKRKRRQEAEEEDEEDRKRFRPWSGEGSLSPGKEDASSGQTYRHDEDDPSPDDGRRRNYKNMTRERRMEANARERTRVHTISAAFETLRRAVPAYSHNQKLSKLSVLRVAASYILTLSRVVGRDYSADGSRPSLERCVDNVSNTIQMEGKLRKKKEEI